MENKEMKNKQIAKNVILALLINNNEKIIEFDKEIEGLNEIIEEEDYCIKSLLLNENENDNKMKMIQLYNNQDKEIQNSFIIYFKVSKEKVLLITLDLFSEIISWLLFNLKYDKTVESKLKEKDIKNLMKWKKEIKRLIDIPSFLLQVAQLNEELLFWEIFPSITTSNLIMFQKRLDEKGSYNLMNSVISSCFGILERNLQTDSEPYSISRKVDDIMQLFKKDVTVSNFVLFVIILAISPHIMKSLFKSFSFYKSAEQVFEVTNSQVSMECKLTTLRSYFLKLIENINENTIENSQVKNLLKSNESKVITDEVRSLISTFDTYLKCFDNIKRQEEEEQQEQVKLQSFNSFFKIMFPLDSTEDFNLEQTLLLIKNRIMGQEEEDDELGNNNKRMKFNEEEDKDFNDLIVCVPNNFILKDCENIFDDVRYTPIVFDDTNMMKMKKEFYIEDICNFGNLVKVIKDFDDDKRFNPLDGFHGLMYPMLTQMILSRNPNLFINFIKVLSYLIHPNFYKRVKPHIEKINTDKYMNEFTDFFGDLHVYLSCCFAEGVDETNAEMRNTTRVIASIFVLILLESIELTVDLSLLGKVFDLEQNKDYTLRDFLTVMSSMLTEEECAYTEEIISICNDVVTRFMSIDELTFDDTKSYNTVSASLFNLLQDGTKNIEPKIFGKRFGKEGVEVEEGICEKILKSLGHFERFNYSIDYTSFEFHFKEMKNLYKFHEFKTLKNLDFPLFRAFNGAGRTCAETPDSYIILQSEMACIPKCYINGIKDTKHFISDSFYGIDNNIMTLISLYDSSKINIICRNFRSFFEIHQ